MLEDAENQTTNELNARVAQVTKERLVRILENLDHDHNILFVQGTLTRVIEQILAIMLKDKRVWEAFEAATIQVASRAPLVQAIGKMLVQKEKIVAPIDMFMTN